MKETDKYNIDADFQGLNDHRELRKMGSDRIRQLLDQTYELRKNKPKTNISTGNSMVHYVWNDYIDEWISVVEKELLHRENKVN